MHFALPPKGGAHSTSYSRNSRSTSFPRRRPLQVTAIVAVAFCTIYLFLSFFVGGDVGEIVPSGTPKVVIVTVFDDKAMSKEFIDRIKQNRMDYAERHGYANFFANTETYKPYTGNSPSSWALVPALRHAMTLNPHVPWFFSLSAHSLIMNSALSLHEQLLDHDRMSSLMLKDIPVVPPDSVIHTFSHLKPEKVDLILTQDGDSLAHQTFLLRKGEWAKYFLDSWFDGLYRSYNFQKAEGHALEHLVQWHPTILSHLILVPQRILNSYNFESSKNKKSSTDDQSGSLYTEGDLLVHLSGCDTGGPSRDCEKEMEQYWGRWREMMTVRRGGG